MTNYRVYINNAFIGKAIVESYLPSDMKINCAVKLLNRRELKDGSEDLIVRENRHSISNGIVTLIESFDD